MTETVTDSDSVYLLLLTSPNDAATTYDITVTSPDAVAV